MRPYDYDEDEIIQDQYTHHPHADFLRYMDAELARLRELRAKKERGEYVDPAPFIQWLQEIGALDENGETAWPYRDGDLYMPQR